MPPKPKDKKRKLKQKQKQKQVVKQSVRVNVQSSGGSGGGGSAGGSVPPFVPSAFNEARLATLLENVARKVPVQQPIYVPTGEAIPARNVEAVPANPLNDTETLKAVFNKPINFDRPIELGGIGQERPIARKKSKPIKVERQQSTPETSEAGFTRAEAGYESVASAFEEPQALGFGFPSTVFARTPYGKIVPKFGESVEPSLASVAMGGAQKEQPVFSGFSVFKSGSGI